jgi:hypothetical protein
VTILCGLVSLVLQSSLLFAIRRITGAATILAEVLATNQGPTKLDCGHMDYSVIANGLRGKSRLKSLKLFISRNVAADCNQETI